MNKATVVGAGLAGCEAAWQLASRGIPVTLCEMKPHAFTPAHHSAGFAELVCANSLRSDKAMRKLEAMLIVASGETLMIVSGTGEVIEPDDGIAAVGSGGNYAMAAARALKENTDLSAHEIAEKALHIAADICVFTNHNVIVEDA